MKFIEIILANSDAKESRLYKPALKAMEKPDTGVTINIPAAYNVIKDSATIAVKYIPHLVFGMYANPFDALKGKFSFTDVKEFVEASHKDFVLNQLLVIILNKIGGPVQTTTTTSGLASLDNPYGDYESYSGVQVEKSTDDPVKIICKAFGVIN